MKTFQTILAVVGTMLLSAAAARADWDPTMPTKWVQLPDLNPLPGAVTAMDVNATWRLPAMPPQPQYPFVKVLGDDFPCTTTGPITGIHVWGSWLDDRMNPNTRFHLRIYDDVPANAANPYSHPGNLLWQRNFLPGSYQVKPWASAIEQFYDPNTDSILGNDTMAWQYNFPVPPAAAFVQQGTTANPKTYWLTVQAAVPGDEVFGWKTSINHWNDDAVFADTNLPQTLGGVLTGPAPAPVYWHDMIYPVGHPYAGQSIDLAFAITTTVPEPGTWALLAVGGAAVAAYGWRRRKTRAAASAAVFMLAIVIAASPASANQLVDPSFESNPLTGYSNVLTNFPGFQGQWGVEVATIVGAENGVTPAHAVKMLRMDDDGLVATQGFQTTDVSALAGVIDAGGANYGLSALFNVDKGVPAAVAAVHLHFFSAANWASQIGGGAFANLNLDNSPATWEIASVTGTVPVGTRWVMSEVRYSDASLMGIDGVVHPGYVDAADLRVTPEPSTMALLGFGGLAGLLLWVRRRRRTV